MPPKFTEIVQSVPAPTGVPEPQTAVTAVAAWTVLATIEAGKYRHAHIRLKTADAFLVFQLGTTLPTKDGISYPVNAPIVLTIDPTATKLLGKRDDAGSDSTVTWTLFED